MAADGRTKSEIRQAATVILIREHEHVIQIYLTQRHGQSGFMGGLYVFPGGTVDQTDRDIQAWTQHCDYDQGLIDPARIDHRLGGEGLDPQDIMGFCLAGIRETFEEAGVFIPINDEITLKDISDLNQQRLQGGLPPGWMLEFICQYRQHQNPIDLSSLLPWAHWITPPTMRKRFDTRFFITQMPEEQSCQPDNREIINGIWMDPFSALRCNLDGTIPLSPPTIVTLTQLTAYDTFEDLLEDINEKRWEAALEPFLVKSDEGPVIVEPWDPDYQTKDLDLCHLENKILEPGEPFSRIWCKNGLWLPVGL